jgi:hypothetical protein
MTAFWQGPTPWFGMDQPPSWNAQPAHAAGADSEARGPAEPGAGSASHEAPRPDGDEFVTDSIQLNYQRSRR